MDGRGPHHPPRRRVLRGLIELASPDDDLEVGGHTIPAAELEWRFTTSGGPGGQHANRSNTRAELVFDIGASAVLPEELRRRMIENLDADVVAVSVAESRSQFRNRMLARARLRDRLEAAMKVERTRRPTKPTRSSKKRRVDDKRARGEKKRLRQRPDVD